MQTSLRILASACLARLTHRRKSRFVIHYISLDLFRSLLLSLFQSIHQFTNSIYTLLAHPPSHPPAHPLAHSPPPFTPSQINLIPHIPPAPSMPTPISHFNSHIINDGSTLPSHLNLNNATWEMADYTSDYPPPVGTPLHCQLFPPPPSTTSIRPPYKPTDHHHQQTNLPNQSTSKLTRPYPGRALLRTRSQPQSTSRYHGKAALTKSVSIGAPLFASAVPEPVRQLAAVQHGERLLARDIYVLPIDSIGPNPFILACQLRTAPVAPVASSPVDVCGDRDIGPHPQSIHLTQIPVQLANSPIYRSTDSTNQKLFRKSSTPQRSPHTRH